jgi:hypothetical protein
MKKLILGVIVIFALAAASAAVYYTLFEGQTPAESVIPADAALFVKFLNIDRQVKEFKASGLYKNIEKIDIDMLLEKSGAKKEDVENFRTARMEMSSFIAGLVLDKYFGKEIAVAVYPVKSVEFTPDALPRMLSNVTLVTRVKPEVNFIDFISKVLNKAGKKYELTEENYRNYKITVVKLDDKFSIAYVKIKDLLVIGVDRKAAMAACDISERKLLSLAQDKNYIAAMSKIPKGADTIAYGNIGLALGGIKEFLHSVSRTFGTGQTAEQRQAFEAQIEKSTDIYSGFRTFSYAKYPGKIVKERMAVNIDRSKLDPMFKGFYSVKARKDAALRFAPANALIYDWNTFDWRSYWAYIKNDLSKDPGMNKQGLTFSDMVSGFEKQIGMSVEKDLIPALGDETGLVLTDINLDGMIPMPNIVLFAKVDKKPVLDKMLSNLIPANIQSSLQTESYKGVDIKYLALPFGLAFQPAYGYVGDYFLISLGRESIKGSVDSYSGASKSLFEDPDFKAVNNGLMEPSNKVSFVRTGALMQKVKGLCEWGSRWLSFMSEQQKKYKEMVDSQVNKIKEDMQATEEEVADLKVKKEDPAVTPEVAAKIDSDIKEREDMISMLREQLDQLLANNQQQKKGSLADLDMSLVRIYLENALYPILDGMQSLKASGSRTIYTGDSIRTECFSEISE